MSLQSLKRAVNAAADAFAEQAIKVSDAVWGFAEEPLHEFQSSRLLRETLSQGEFRVEREFRALPTAFTMAAGRGRPRIGILAEYDALPNCGLAPDTFGHGCSHHLLGAGSMLAALTAHSVTASRPRLRGTVVLLGCPAEETLAGKVYMARDGAFDDLDAVLAWHPGEGSAVQPEGGAAMDSYAFEFFGKTAHGASAHAGRSALDAVELMDHAVNILREHVPENVRIHSCITCGGGAPNVVPEYARSWYYVRARNRKQVDEVAGRVIRCARAAAAATETRLKKTLLSAVYERLPNQAFTEHLGACLRTMGPPRFDEADERARKRLKLKKPLPSKIGEPRSSPGRGSSDQDSVSWISPLASLNVACKPGSVPSHHRDTTRVGKARFAHKGMVHAGKVLALAALSLFEDRKALGRIKREFRRRTQDFTYDPLVPKRQLPPVRDTIPKRPPTPEA